METVDARLEGEPGILRTYVVQNVQVRHFSTSESPYNKFSFDDSAWLDAPTVSQNGNTRTILFNVNPLTIHSYDETTTTTSRRVCS